MAWLQQRWGRAAWRLWLAAWLVAALAGGGGLPVSADAYRVMVGRVDSSQFPEVRFNVTVLDHRYVPLTNLNASSFELIEDGKPVQPTSVMRVVDGDNPIAVMFGVDSNAAMEGFSLREVKEAVGDFIFNLTDNDSVAAISFGDQVKLLHRFTSDRPAVAARVREVRAQGTSLLYDAVMEALEVTAREPTPRKVLVFLSDGMDTGSQRPLSEVVRRAAELRIPIFSIGIGEDVNMDALRRLADASGGVALYAPTSLDILGAYQTVANHLRSEYVVRFRSNLKADAARHTLTVRPIVPDARPSAEVAFIAVKNPPNVEMIEPPIGAELKDLQPVEARITSIAAVTKVEFTANGKVLATLTEPPWRFEWNTEELKSGQHTLNVSVTDSADNRVTRFVPLVVTNREKPVIKTLQPSAPPASTRVAGSGLPLPGWLVTWLVALPLIAAGVKLGFWLLKRYVPLTCSTHKVKYIRGGVCPKCAAEAGTSIDSRLRRFAGFEPDSLAAGTPPAPAAPAAPEPVATPVAAGASPLEGRLRRFARSDDSDVTPPHRNSAIG